jgi:hypothetical protein
MTQPRYHTVKLPMRLGRIRCTEPEALLGAAQRLFSSTGAERPGGREHRSAENSLWMAGAVEFLPSLEGRISCRLPCC